MKRALEFFESDTGSLSMARLLQFMAYPPATGVMLWIHTTEAMSLYLAAFVTNGVLGKAIDMKAKTNANSRAVESAKKPARG